MRIARKRALLVDNTEIGYAQKQGFSELIGGEAAGSPVAAERAIEAAVKTRKKEIGGLLVTARRQCDLAKTPREKAMLTRQIHSLEAWLQRPFELVAFDVDLTGYKGNGMAIHRWMKVARRLHRESPSARVVIRSKQPRFFRRAKRWSARVLKNTGSPTAEFEFEDMVKRELGLRLGVSFEKLEKSALKLPVRESLLGLRFRDEMAFEDAMMLVVTRDPKRRSELIVSLFGGVRSGRLSPNTFKAVLRCRRQPETAIYDLTRDENGFVVMRKE